MNNYPKNRLRRFTAAERFWAKVDKGSGCWMWRPEKNPDRYGYLYVDGRLVKAARFSYEMVAGPIPPGLQLDHLCRNRRCVNPAHLEPVTQRENILRGECMTAVNARKTHCLRGHPLSGENLSSYSRGRTCKACARGKALARYYRDKDNPGVTVEVTSC